MSTATTLTPDALQARRAERLQTIIAAKGFNCSPMIGNADDPTRNPSRFVVVESSDDGHWIKHASTLDDLSSQIVETLNDEYWRFVNAYDLDADNYDRPLCVDVVIRINGNPTETPHEISSPHE